MKKSFLLLFLLCLSNHLFCQEILVEQPIQPIIISAIEYIKNANLSEKKDIIIISTDIESRNYFKVKAFQNDYLEAYNVTPPSLEITGPEIIKINSDSISDIIWIKGKKWTRLMATSKEIPFHDLNGNLFDKGFEEIKSNLATTLYFNRLYNNYGSIKILKSKKAEDLLLPGSLAPYKVFEIKIAYPQLAREYGIQGKAKIGYVLTEECEAKEFYVFEDPGEGCAQSLIDSVKKMSDLLRESRYKNNEALYIIEETEFKLN